ncbi:MAG: hypothetical protein H7Y43_03895 [Akkermansiaceae bacterium]|nr:hypothetical protein [Verrucomicrobiales bacterium]
MTGTETVHRYRAFSLEIESQLPLPELKGSSAAPEIAIRFGSILKPEDSPESDRCVSANADEVHLFWKRAGSFLIRGGTEMVIQPVADAEEALLRTGILGPGFATLLQQRGHLVLHASSVVIGGKAVAFVGWKGQGKSTMAATLFARGHTLVTDDLLALNGQNKEPVLAHPGFPQFKLWPDSAESSLGVAPESLPRLMAGYEKRVRLIKEGFATEPTPLSAIYVLTTGTELAAHRLSPGETFKQIVSNTFCARYGSRVFEGKMGTDHLQSVARVAGQVPVFRLERPSSLAQLNSLADFVVQHATGL